MNELEVLKQVRSIFDQTVSPSSLVMNQIERRPQYDSDDDVIARAVQQFYDELKNRQILR